MAVILSFYGLLLLLAVAVAVFVYRRLRRWGRLPAAGASLLVVVLAALLYPLPIHGGFITVLEIMIDELGRQRVVWQDQAKDARQDEFLRQLEERFAGPLTYQELEPAENGWQAVEVAGQRAWLETGHQLLWSRATPWREPADFSLAGPRRYCRQLAPVGYWSLPTVAEMVLFWQAEGAAATGGPAVNAAAFSVDEQLQSELPSLHLGGELRCVGRTAAAPPRGYIDSDIPRDAWNRYQLQVLNGR